MLHNGLCTCYTSGVRLERKVEHFRSSNDGLFEKLKQGVSMEGFGALCETFVSGTARSSELVSREGRNVCACLPEGKKVGSQRKLRRKSMIDQRPNEGIRRHIMRNGVKVVLGAGSCSCGSMEVFGRLASL